MEIAHNKAVSLNGRAIAGSHEYEQIPSLVELCVQRTADFYTDLEQWLADVPSLLARTSGSPRLPSS